MRTLPKVILDDVDVSNNAMEPIVFGNLRVHWWRINETFPDGNILVHAMGFMNRHLTMFRGPHCGRNLIELYRMTLDMSRSEKFDQVRERILSLREKGEADEDARSVFRSFIQEMYQPDDRSNIIEYLKDWTSHPKMDVQDYSTRLKVLNNWVQWMPGNEEALTDVQIDNAIAHQRRKKKRIRKHRKKKGKQNPIIGNAVETMDC